MTSRDKLWIPVIVTLVGDSVRVSTSKGVDEFRARRLIWNGPESFVITGLAEGSRFTRAHLRLTSHEEAIRAASMLKERLGLEEQPVTQIEEVQVEVRFLISSTELFLQIPSFLIRLAISGFVIAIFSAPGHFRTASWRGSGGRLLWPACVGTVATDETTSTSMA